MLGLYAVVTVFLALVFSRPTAPTAAGIAAIAGVLIAAVLLVSPSVTPLPRWRTVAVILIVVCAVIAVTLQQPFHDRPPGQAAWELGCGNFLLFGMALRGRVVAAWIGELATIAVVCIWSVAVTGSPLYGLSFTYGQPVSLIAGTVFAVALHRTARSIIAFRASERERAGNEAREAAVSEVRDADLQFVRKLAEPSLRQIAAGEAIDRDKVRTLEAALRDLIRGRSLAIEPLVGALRSARERGVDIVVLDDLGEHRVSDESLAQAVRWCAAQILDSAASSITLRVAPSEAMESSAVIVTMSIDGQPARTLSLSERDRKMPSSAGRLVVVPSDGRRM
jgi:hypothetical protein